MTPTLKRTARAAAVRGDAAATNRADHRPVCVVCNTPSLYTRFNHAAVMGFQTARKYLATFACFVWLLL